MSAVETPPAAARRCPRCDAALGPEQEWCLNCGGAVRTRIAPTPGWRAPLVLLGLVGALVALAVVFALYEASDDTEPMVRAAPSATPVPTPVPTPTPTPVPDPGAPPPASDPGTAGAGAGGLQTWPAGRTAWTVVLASSRSEASARRRAEALAAQGRSVGLIDANAFRSLTAGSWYVVSGQYDDRAAAEQARAALGAEADRAYTRRVVPR